MSAELDATLAALADPARRRLIEALREAPRRSGDLAETLGVPRPTASRHLRVLRRAGLVEEVPVPQDARARMYRLRPQPFGQLRGWLDDLEAFWAGQLEAFIDYAEGAPSSPTTATADRPAEALPPRGEGSA